MKINTDGVLLGALAGADGPGSILDIGTGTGVIALMLAQRFAGAVVDAVEIDETAAKTAALNFGQSVFAGRLNLYPVGFEEFFKSKPAAGYDLIVSNPPFYINSLQSPGEKKSLAKHAGEGFFEALISHVAAHLNPGGCCWLVLPPDTARLVKDIAQEYGLAPQKVIDVCSFATSQPHRQLLCLGTKAGQVIEDSLIIYDEPKVYSKAYRLALKDFLTVF